MGGSGGGWSRSSGRAAEGGGSSGSGSQVDDCARIGGTVPLSSPVPAIVNGLSVGQSLDLVVRGGQVFVESQGTVAGVILAGWVNRLIDCIHASEAYSAVVTSLNGGLCEVTVRHV